MLHRIAYGPIVKAANDGHVKPITNPIKREMVRNMQRVFARQAQETLGRKVWENMDLEWLKSEKWADEIVDLTKNQVGYYAKLGAKNASQRVGIVLTDYIDRPRVQQALRREAYKFAEAAGDTSSGKLKYTLAEGTKLGESIPQLSERIKEVFGFNPNTQDYTPYEQGDELENWRAEMIARTETARAYSVGQRTAWVETEVVEAFIWDAAGDACPFCLALDGKEIPTDENFFEKGDTMRVNFKGERIEMAFEYSDVLGPPLHPDCFLHHTVPIMTDHGEKQIGSIQVGDNVLTALGRFRPVVRVLGNNKRYHGPAIRIQYRGPRYTRDNRSNIIVTPEHPMLTARGWAMAKDLIELDSLFVMAKECAYCGKKIPYWKKYCCGSCSMLDNPEALKKIVASKTGINNWMHGRTGIKHHLWRGGKIWWRGAEWDTLKRRIVERDGFKCQDCGMTEEQNLEKSKQPLHVHHLNPYRDSHDNSPSNLITLCVSCHAKREGTVNPRFLHFGGASFIEVPIVELERIDMFHGEKLFNFAVAEDESYVAHGVVTHNCRCGLRAKL